MPTLCYPPDETRAAERGWQITASIGFVLGFAIGLDRRSIYGGWRLGLLLGPVFIAWEQHQDGAE